MKQPFTRANAKIMGRAGGRARTPKQQATRALNGLSNSSSPLASMMKLAGSTNVEEAVKFFVGNVAQAFEDIQKVRDSYRRVCARMKVADTWLSYMRTRFADFDHSIDYQRFQFLENYYQEQHKKFEHDLAFAREFYEKKRKEKLQEQTKENMNNATSI